MREIHYRRLSHATDESTSITRQGRDLAAAAAADGNVVVADLVDEGISGRVNRANADEALRMLRDGEADVLRVWKFDRWSRMGLSAIADLIDVLDARPDALFIALRDGLRSDQPAWRIIAAVLAEVARMEAEATATRTRSSHEYARRVGFYHGGVVPFGYRICPHPTLPKKKGLEPDPIEAPALRRMAAMALSGASLTDLLRHLETHGPAPRRAAHWHPVVLQRILTSQTMLGRTLYENEPIYDETGTPLAPWEPLVDLETFYALRERFADPRGGGREPTGKQARPRRNRAARLLSGLLYCGTCNSRMYANYQRDTRADGTRVDRSFYRCGAHVQHVECANRAYVQALELEEFIAQQFLADFGRLPYVVARERHVGPSPAALAEVGEAINRTLDGMRDPKADRAALLAQLDALQARERELQTAAPGVEVVYERDGRTLADVWLDADDSGRRRLLSDALDHVVVAGGGRGRAFDPSRVTPVWASGEVETAV